MSIAAPVSAAGRSPGKRCAHYRSTHVGTPLRHGPARRLRLRDEGESKQPREEIPAAKDLVGHGEHLPANRVVFALDR